MKMKKVLISIFLVILIFFSFTNNVQANFFTDDEEDKKSEIEETIDKDEGGLFEKIIAKMIRRRFCFTNKIQVNSNDVQEIKKFNLLFVYDQDTQNYVPVIENVQECAFIESYKVYNTGIEITLNKGVQLTNTEYTLKINRYNDELQIRDRKITNNAYYYDYEPVVTKMEGYENRIVLEMRFDRSYTIEELKNIEIIFGNY